MRRRSNNNEEGSLDLLLDTICNVFGGIIFIAMLVALLTMSKSETMRVDTRRVADVLAEEPGMQPQEIDDRISTLKLSIASMAAVLEAMGGEGANKSAEAFKALRGERDNARERIARLEEWISDFEKATSEQADGLEAELGAIEQRINSLEQSLEALADASTIDARLPIARRTRKQQLMFAVKGRRLHWIPSGAAASRYDHDFSEQVETKGLHSGGVQVEPIVSKGIEITSQMSEETAFKTLIAKSNADRDFFHLFVWPDSVSEASLFKSLILKHGYAYQFETIGAGETLVLVDADHVETQ